MPASVRRLTTIVCPAEEVSDHLVKWADDGVQVLAQPDEIRTIGQKREWIFLHAAKNVEFAWQLDDDLRFKVASPAGRLVAASTNPDTFSAAWPYTMDRMAGYEAQGLGTSYFAPIGKIKENYHLGFAFGFSKRVREEVLRFGLDVFEDIAFTLDCLINGVRIAVSYDVTVDQIKPTDDQSPPEFGGVAGERQEATISRDLAELVARFPGIVSEKPRRPGAHPAAVTKVLWQRAAKQGGLR